jgi:ABC-type lipoprotein export system ATPase subunit
MELRAHMLKRSVTLPNGEMLAILTGVTLTVGRGEKVAILGRSGSGKSTLLALLGMLDRPDSGYLHVDGVDSGGLSDAERSLMRCTRFGFVFQNFSLLPHLTASENVELPLLQGPRVTRSRAKRMVADTLAAVGLGDRGDARPRQLSGGEQQRVAIARSVVRNPEVIFADEPTGALDRATAERVLEVMARTVSVSGASLVLVTHDEGVARTADRMLELRQGRLPHVGGHA